MSQRYTYMTIWFEIMLCGVLSLFYPCISIKYICPNMYN